MTTFEVAYAGAPQSKRKIDAVSDSDAALQFLRLAPHSNQIIVEWGLFGRHAAVYRASDFKDIYPSIPIDALTLLPSPPEPEAKGFWSSKIVNWMIKGEFTTWDRK